MFRAILGLQRVMSIALRQADAVVKWVALLVFKRFRFVSFISLAIVTPLVSVLWDLHKILWLLKSPVMTNGFGSWPKIRVSSITLVAITKVGCDRNFSIVDGVLDGVLHEYSVTNMVRNDFW